MKLFDSNRYNEWYNCCNRLNNLNTNLSRKQQAAKLPSSVVTDHLEKIYTVSLTITVATNPYIHCNEINYSHSKVVQKQPGNSPLLTVITDLHRCNGFHRKKFEIVVSAQPLQQISHPLQRTISIRVMIV
jgi:hypothetical protein